MSHYINSLWRQAIKTGMSSQSQNYSLVILNDRVVPGFAGIMRESVRARNSASDRELKIVVASPSNVLDGKAINFAKEVTKHVRISRGWSFVSASVQSMGSRELQRRGDARASRLGRHSDPCAHLSQGGDLTVTCARRAARGVFPGYGCLLRPPMPNPAE